MIGWVGHTWGSTICFYSSVVMMATCYKKRGPLYTWIKRKDCKRKEHRVVASSESFHLLMRLLSLFYFIFLFLFFLLPFFIILISWWGPSDRLARDRAGNGVSDHVRLLSLVSKARTSGGQCHVSSLHSLPLFTDASSTRAGKGLQWMSVMCVTCASRETSRERGNGDDDL